MTSVNVNSLRDYSNSRPLDVHVWSHYPEVNDFVNLIYNCYFSGLNYKHGIAKRHIKLVLLDLYVAWLTDPDLNIAVHMTKNHYSKNFGTDTTRYNELNITAKTRDIIHILKDNGLIGYYKGNEANKKISRIWALPKLIEMFEKSALNEFMAYSSDSRAVLILRDKDEDDIKHNIPYDTTEDTHAKSVLVHSYNHILERSFIDIGSADTPVLTIEKNKGSKNPNKPHRVRLSHKGKFTHRVFNNSSWSEGGRFYGGFWQRIGQNYREQILINDEETVELDFSSMHPVLAYAKKGVDYWKDIGTDPYDLPVAQINDPDISRHVVKKLILLALNANNDDELFRAFRSEFDYSLLGGLEHKFTNDALDKIVDSIKAKHPKIADQIATGAGTKLMNLDSRIVEFVIERFINNNTVVLSVHDSFIVPVRQRDMLLKAMQDAWEFVTGYTEIKYKQSVPIHQDAAVWRDRDYDYYHAKLEDLRKKVKSTKRTTGYLNRLNKHNKFFNPKPTKSKSVQYTPDEIVMPKQYKKYQK